MYLNQSFKGGPHEEPPDPVGKIITNLNWKNHAKTLSGLVCPCRFDSAWWNKLVNFLVMALTFGISNVIIIV